MLQLHGDEGPAFCARGGAPHRLQGDQGGAGAQPRRRPGARRVPHRLPPARQLHRPACRGGTGETFAWEIARGHRRPPVPVILSGGLTPDNVAEAIAAVGPFAVDVASGVEAAPGARTRRSSRRSRPPCAPAERVAARGGAAAHERGRASFRALRRPVRARDADAGARGARGGLAAARATTPTSRPSSTGCCATTSAGRHRSTCARRLSEAAGHPIYLKREDLNHTGAHKINNALGQALLAKRMGKRADHRRDRRRPARRGHRHRLRAARPRVRRVHGHRGHAPAAAQRRAHGAARRARRAGRGRARARSRRRSPRRSATG